MVRKGEGLEVRGAGDYRKEDHWCTAASAVGMTVIAAKLPTSYVSLKLSELSQKLTPAYGPDATKGWKGRQGLAKTAMKGSTLHDHSSRGRVGAGGCFPACEE